MELRTFSDELQAILFKRAMQIGNPVDGSFVVKGKNADKVVGSIINAIRLDMKQDVTFTEHEYSYTLKVRVEGKTIWVDLKNNDDGECKVTMWYSVA